MTRAAGTVTGVYWLLATALCPAVGATSPSLFTEIMEKFGVPVGGVVFIVWWTYRREQNNMKRDNNAIRRLQEVEDSRVEILKDAIVECREVIEHNRNTVAECTRTMELFLKTCAECRRRLEEPGFHGFSQGEEQ